MALKNDYDMAYKTFLEAQVEHNDTSITEHIVFPKKPHLKPQPEPHPFVHWGHCSACRDEYQKQYDNPEPHDYTANPEHCRICYTEWRQLERARLLEAQRIEEQRIREIEARRCKQCRSLALCVHRVRTQKARGVLTLVNRLGNVPTASIVQEEAQIADAYANILYSYTKNQKIFARPCPVRPRHGFVDSRIVKSVDDARTVFQAAQAADPEAELILMPVIDAAYNAVWTPGRMAIGPGNDGATAGRNSFSISLARPTNETAVLWRNIAEQAGIVEPDQPYVEAVYQTKITTYAPFEQFFLTQIRGGPALPGGIDFIPTPMEVTEVVVAEGDLLEWEQRAKGFTPGTVVHHPGGSMTSHYAIHCVLNTIPILVSRKPEVGETLQPTEVVPALDMQSVLQGIGAGTALELSEKQYASAVAALLTGLHNVTAFSDTEGFWLGAAVALMHRLGSVALLGEARHATNREGHDRERIYKERIQTPFQTRRRLHRAMWMFQHYPWSRGYGGKAWADCGKSLLKLDQEIRKFTLAQRKKHYTSLVTVFNEVINKAHNGGWWLNKFAPQELMDQAATGDPRPALQAMAIFARLRNVDQETRTRMISFWQATHEIPLAIGPDRLPELPVIKPKIDTTLPHLYVGAWHCLACSNTLANSFNVTLPEKYEITTTLPEQQTGEVTHAQVRLDEGSLHIQYKLSGHPQYLTKEVSMGEFVHTPFCIHKNYVECIKSHPMVNSLSGSHTKYFVLNVDKESGSLYHFIIMTNCHTCITTIETAKEIPF